MRMRWNFYSCTKWNLRLMPFQVGNGTTKTKGLFSRSNLPL